MEMSDDTLVSMVLQGENEAFAYIVERYKIQIYNLMYRYSNTREDAADMTQDVFCRAFERLNRYQKRDQFFSWLYTLALNHAKDWTKKRNIRRRKMAQLSAEADSNEAVSTHLLVEADQKSDKLMAALETLPDDRREMLVLRYRYERSIRELSEVFDLSESAVKMRLQRALEALRSELKIQDDG